MNRFICCLFLTVSLGVSSAVAAEPEFPTRFDWGQLVATDDSVQLHVKSAPADGKVTIPRINNPYRRIFVQSAPTTTLKFVPEVKDWVITLPPPPFKDLIIVLETVGRPNLLSAPYVISADANGEFVLPAHHAIVHGQKLRYEPQPHKNTVGYWTEQSDWCEWKIDVAEPNQFRVHVLQGCGKGNGGSEVEVSVGDSRCVFQVEDTGHFQNFTDRVVGHLQVQGEGQQSVQVRAIRKAKAAVMDVRQLRLVPVNQ